MSAPARIAVRLAATSFGALAFGPLGGILGGTLAEIFKEHIDEDLFKESGAKISEFLIHDCYEQFRELRERPLESVARQALRAALQEIAPTAPEYNDWFKNWDTHLKGTAPLPISSITQIITSDELHSAPEATLDHLFRATMERLDGESRASATKSLSIAPQSFRKIDDTLVDILKQHLPEPLHRHFHELLEKPDNRPALAEVTAHFRANVQHQLRTIVRNTVEIKEDTTRIREILEHNSPTSPFFAPSEPDFFVGRETPMNDLHRRLGKPGAVVPLTGMPGLGKTSLAIAFAHRHASDFEGVYWLNAAGLSLQSAATALATQLNIRPDAELPDLLKEIRLRGQRHCLWVLDNVETDDFHELIPSGRASVLITTRHPGLPFLTKYRQEDLKLFTSDECLNLFHKYELPVSAKESQYRELAESLGRLPLGVAVAAGLLKNDVHYTLDTLLHETKLHRLAHGELNINRLLTSAIASAPESARNLLSAMAVCAPSGFRLSLTAEIAGMTESESLDALHVLRSRSLVEELDRETRRYRLHALIRGVAGQDATLKHRHAEAVAERFKTWEQHWRESEEDLPDWRLALAWANAKRSDQFNLLARLTDAGFGFLRRRGLLTEAFYAIRVAGAASEELGDRVALQASYGNQAIILKDWGKLEEAMVLYKQQEAICKELGDRTGLQASYGNQAGVLQIWGKLKEAMALHKREEAICEELGDRVGLQASYGNQALILRAWGKLEEAMALHKREEAICEELGDRNSLQVSYGNQALVLKAWSRLEEAMALYKRQEAICEELGNRGSLQRSYGNQAGILQRLGKLEEAMALHKRKEAICRELGLRSGLQIGLHNQALLLEQMGEPEKAAPLRAEAAAIQAELMKGRPES
jgi:tetratricopeptide (TPR) repeat protein